MALSGIEASKTATTGAIKAKFEEWSGVIAWVIRGFIALVIVIPIALLVIVTIREGKKQARQAVWDKVYLGTKEIQGTEDKIAALEKVWKEVQGTVAQPYVAMDLAHLHYEIYQDEDRSEASRKRGLENSLKLYELILSHWPENVLLSPIASEGLALGFEQKEDFDGALRVLDKALEKHGKHFLAFKLFYQKARVLWLRAQSPGAKDPQKDREEAREAVNKALVDQEGRFPSSWHDEAAYLKACLAEPGKAWNKAPPPPKPEIKKEENKTEGEKGEKKEGTKEEKAGQGKAEKEAAPTGPAEASKGKEAKK